MQQQQKEGILILCACILIVVLSFGMERVSLDNGMRIIIVRLINIIISFAICMVETLTVVAQALASLVRFMPIDTTRPPGCTRCSEHILALWRWEPLG